MVGLHRHKFIDIISDKIVNHYQGKVSDKELTEAILKVKTLINRLDDSKKENAAERAANLRQLKKMSLDKLKAILSEKA